MEASDAHGDRITYSLTGPEGMTIDTQFGLVEWTQTNVAPGSYPWSVTITDEYLSSTTVNYTLEVVPDTENPELLLEVQDDPGPINEENRFRVTATDNVEVVAPTLEVSANGGTTWTPIELGPTGVGHWTPTQVLVYKLRATATDAAGNTETFIRDLNSIDPTATGAPR